MIQKDLHKISPYTFLSYHNYCSFLKLRNTEDQENIREIEQLEIGGQNCSKFYCREREATGNPEARELEIEKSHGQKQ